MPTLIGVLQILSALAPLVKDAVSAAEGLIGPGRGTEKLAHAVAKVEEALPKVEQLARVGQAAHAAIRPMIEATVAAANASGEFKTTAKAAPARRRSSRRKK